MNIKAKLMKADTPEELEEKINGYIGNIDGNNIVDIKYRVAFNDNPGVFRMDYSALLMIKFN